VLSDFESGKGSLFPVPSSNTTGFWYSYKDTTTCASAAQVPVAVTDSAVVAADVSGAGGPHDSGNACNKYAMHSSISGCQTYSGFGAALHPVLGGTIRNAVDLSAYDGLSFWIKAGTGTQGPLYLEFNSKECIPAVRGGVAVSPAIDQDNCHGKLLTSIPTTWTQMYVPFGTTGARWFPTAGASGSGKSCASGDFCEAPALNPANMLSFQFALEDPFNQKPALASSYDVWVDDVAFYKFSDTPKDAGLKTWTQSGTNSFPQDKTFTGCTKPTGATGKLIQDAYVNWKAKFVVASGNGMKVVSPEIDSGATVSEGMGYGMLMAVYMGDKALFDGLLAYWKSNASGQSMLMTWKIPGGSGSASDADEDTAFALQMAVKQWGSSYATDASTILSQFLANDVDGNNYLKPGNTFGGQNLTNPSYFAPAFYRYFASVDTGNASKWNALVANTYTQLGNISGSNGLVPAWCTANCMTRGSGGLNYADELTYQYDAHRTPWRIGLDVCWNGASTASAGKSYLDKVVGFFAGASNTAGISSLADIYSAGGAPTAATGGTIVYNSMSLDGCAGVGAMGSSAANAASFRDRVWKFLLAGQYSDNPTFKVGDSATKPGYTYYNATVGLITLMTMSGNFYPM
jgi:endo-1,4-beta-D-glucanase Y